MMGSIMGCSKTQRQPSRRVALLHCSLLALGGGLAGLPGGQLQAATGAATGAATPAASPAARKILVLGDSLSAEYGLARGNGWVALLEQRLAQEKVAASVVNASISGDTTSGGRSRLPALLTQHRPSHVVIELGGNDALRGLPLDMTRDNLLAIARQTKAAGAKVMVVGMQVPPNYGARYGQDFAALFASVAKAEGAALVPFLLAGVADSAQADQLFQPDRIHPRAEAHPKMLANVWVVMKAWLR
jgi:acyl-CoA thioesterase-1